MVLSIFHGYFVSLKFLMRYLGLKARSGAKQAGLGACRAWSRYSLVERSSRE
jgi:hypothetical protein